MLKRTLVDKIKVDKFDLIETIEKYHDLDYFVEVTLKETAEASVWDGKTPIANYTMLVYKFEKKKDEN